MATTIQVEDKTLRVLRQLKSRLKAKTFDEVIRKLVHTKSKAPASFFGARPHMRPFTCEDHLKVHDEE